MPEKRRVTVNAIADEAAVSVSTVSLALRGKANIPPETRQRVLDAAKKLGYVPKTPTPRSSSANITHLGLLIRTLQQSFPENPFYSVVQTGIEMACRKHQINLVYSNLPVDNDSRILDVPRMLLDDQVDGMLAMGLYLNELNIQFFERLSVPVVLVDAYSEVNRFDAVHTANQAGAFEAVNYLIENGHRRIAIAGSHSAAFPSILGRRQGYFEALRRAGIDEPVLIDSELDRQPVYEAVYRYLSDRTNLTAIFCVNDWVAVGVMKAVRDLGLRIPEDISIIGFDDDLLAPHITPSLTTMQVDKIGMGRLAVTLLLNRLEQPDAGVVEASLFPRLVVRESVCQAQR
jgi:DNA-binding LacI/PurR family transcriptional regulator